MSHKNAWHCLNWPYLRKALTLCVTLIGKTAPKLCPSSVPVICLFPFPFFPPHSSPSIQEIVVSPCGSPTNYKYGHLHCTAVLLIKVLLLWARSIEINYQCMGIVVISGVCCGIKHMPSLLVVCPCCSKLNPLFRGCQMATLAMTDITDPSIRTLL